MIGRAFMLARYFLCPEGGTHKGERLRLFLSDEGYAKALASEKRGEIKIRKHAAIIEGHILADRKKRCR